MSLYLIICIYTLIQIFRLILAKVELNISLIQVIHFIIFIITLLRSIHFIQKIQLTYE